MSPEIYWNTCKKHLSVTVYYEKVMCNTRMILQEKVDDFIRKYKEVLTDKEYEYLKSYNYRFANVYMLPKLHKSQRLNKIIAQSPLQYVKISKILDIERRPIVAGSAYHTHGISILIHKIVEPSLKEISHIIKDTSDFVERTKRFRYWNFSWSCCYQKFEHKYFT